MRLPRVHATYVRQDAPSSFRLGREPNPTVATIVTTRRNRVIVRTWKGRVHPGKGREYLAFLENEVFPHISGLPGSLGARVLRSVGRSGDEYLVMSEWRDLESVKAFAGDDPSQAVVEPEAQALLAEYDRRVEHYEVVLEAE